MATLYGLGNGGIIMFFVMPLPSQFKNQLVEMISAAIADIGAQLPENINIIERPRIAAHGDFSCPLALTLAKQLRRKPQEIAEQLLAAITLPPFVAEAQIVAPGFINFKLHADAKVTVVREVLAAQEQYGIIAPQNESVLLEFVSANPTGPLHVGHGRACAYGDALANILTAAGNEVRCEYYVNNAGRQMDILAASLWLRYWLLQNNDTTPMPEGAYRGDYLVAVTTASTALKTLLQQTQPPADTLADSMTACATTDLAADTLVVAARTAAGSADAYTQLRQQTGTIMLEEVIKK
ncbi:MAG: arginine--tRNA ligase, partial [Proteobacteria bacterium]|nr:arginine--tRNA ligase [Pseudomonadota bacterium]